MYIYIYICAYVYALLLGCFAGVIILRDFEGPTSCAGATLAAPPPDRGESGDGSRPCTKHNIT